MVFLSQDGDSEPVYLWRKRPESEESLTSGAVEPSMTAEGKALADPPGGVERMHNTVNKHEILVFCAQCRTDKNDMQGEGQKIIDIIEGLPGSRFSVKYNPRPSLQVLQGQLRRANDAIGVHFIGHGDEEGLYVVSDDGTQPAKVSAPTLAQLIQNVLSMQMGVLNACDTEDLGRELAQRGLKHVVCWRGKVADAVAERFSQEFYKTLNESPGEYRRAFVEGKLAATMLQDARWNAGERRPSGSPCYLCHSSVDGQGGDILPDDEPVSFLSTTAQVEVDVENDGVDMEAASPSQLPDEGVEAEAADTDDERSLNNRKGAAELEAFKALGFKFDFEGHSVEAGIRMHQEGKIAGTQVRKYGLQESPAHGRKLLYLSPPAVKHIFGDESIRSYTDPALWCKRGPICKKAELASAAGIDKAIKSFEKSLSMRPRGGDSGHDHMRQQIEECVEVLRKCRAGKS